ncbi:MAG: molecular chaperone TorD family protein [Vulcanimicrobiaceae bacterium]
MELFRALGSIVEGAGASASRVAAALGIHAALDPAGHTSLFAFRLYPYASVYLGPEGMLGGEARDRIAGFWRALALDPPEEADHLSTLLALYAALAEAADGEADPARKKLIDHARSALFWEHLASWLPIYLARVARIGAPAYREWATLLDAALAAEARVLGAPTRLALHLRSAPDLPDPRDAGAEAFLSGLLAPVRSGFILVRDDLADAAHELGIGLRHGERRFVLTAMFAQERAGLLRWLGRTACEAAASHTERSAPWPGIAAFWASRARRSAELFDALADEPAVLVP